MKLNIVSIAGGLGNQMFQYAFYLGLKFKSSPNEYSKIFIAPYQLHNGYELDKVFGIRKKLLNNLFVGFIKKYLKPYVYKKQEQPGAIFDQQIEVIDKPFVYYSGYWQTEKHFLEIEDIIRMVFCFNSKKINIRNQSLLSGLKQKNAVSIHFRKGDYENEPGAKMILGGNCDIGYYIRAINFIQTHVSDPYYYIFSDDSVWIQENFSFLVNSMIIDWNKKEDSWQDMMLMSQCNHNIIANSSFSWWGAWLNHNPEKLVIAPIKWFNNIKNQDIIPENWIRL